MQPQSSFSNLPQGTFGKLGISSTALFRQAIDLGGSFSGTITSAGSIAYFIPFEVNRRTTYKRGGVLHSISGTIAGNVDIGIYDVLGNRICSTGATACGNSPPYQSIALSSTPSIDPGNYLTGITFSSTSHQAQGINFSGTAAYLRAMQVYTAVTSGSLPSTVTFTAYGDLVLPAFGITQLNL